MTSALERQKAVDQARLYLKTTMVKIDYTPHDDERSVEVLVDTLEELSSATLIYGKALVEYVKDCHS